MKNGTIIFLICLIQINLYASYSKEIEATTTNLKLAYLRRLAVRRMLESRNDFSAEHFPTKMVTRKVTAWSTHLNKVVTSTKIAKHKEIIKHITTKKFSQKNLPRIRLG